MNVSARVFGWCLAAPALFVACMALVSKLLFGAGLLLAVLFALSAAVTYFTAAAVWRRFGPRSRLAGAGMGLLAGMVAGGLVWGTFVLEGRIGPSFGGSLTRSAANTLIDEGVKAGLDTPPRSGVEGVVMAPTRLVTAPVGGFLGIMLVGLTLLILSGLPLLTGVVGGAVAADTLRRSA